MTARDDMASLHIIALAGFLGLAVAWDLAQRRVPNRLVAAFALGALALAGARNGLGGTTRALGGLVLGSGLLAVPFARGWVGGGDAKFLGTVGGFLGPQLTVLAFLVGSTLGGLAALGALAAARRRGRAGGDAAPHRCAATTALRAAPLPYTVPLALGVVVALALDAVAGGPR